jgi:hypothetical protein
LLFAVRGMCFQFEYIASLVIVTFKHNDINYRNTRGSVVLKESLDSYTFVINFLGI